MDKDIIESMDVTSYSRTDLGIRVNEFLNEGWKLYTGIIDESVITNDETGVSTITFTMTLVRYKD